MNYPQRVYLLYSGIHYDAITAAADGGCETAVFPRQDHSTMSLVRELAREHRSVRGS